MYSFLIDGTLASQWVKKASLSRLWTSAGDQIWIKDVSDSSNFKVFGSVLNLSDQIDLVFLILVP